MPGRTRSQNQVLAALKQLDQPISAQDLYMELRNGGGTLGLATVYRALDALKLEGAVQVRTLPTGESLYSLPQEDRHHLTCLQCGQSIAIDECPVHDLEQQLNRAHHFRIFYHTLEFFGLCPRCQMDAAQAAGS
ncbi:Zinc uptake regulation protein [Halomicronema hongdechloris C2206]|uniref:Zinc uptake regulation protein n=1 Tax=Halomicronema hongdechloris C2206 TaxID=1641165 RepID=A0A1Z3HPR3_9CYAN|nr:Fur family transcriptional regulator [Halomicronema hongdechloris]ASC72300.1 Zinc uptake regulation protein [Halomicronema hongdechloris C2206]